MWAVLGIRTVLWIVSRSWCRPIRNTLAKAFEAEPQLPEIYEADEEVVLLIDMALQALKASRVTLCKHAGGVATRHQNYRLCAAVLR